MEKYPDILAIQSDVKELQKVELFLRKVFLINRLPEESFNKVLLCVSEAIINSIEHGNKNLKEKIVTIEVQCIDKDLCFIVTDEGEGFDHRRVANPTLEENIKKETGRGLFIMKSICNELEYRDEGKCVEIKIELV